MGSTAIGTRTTPRAGRERERGDGMVKMAGRPAWSSGRQRALLALISGEKKKPRKIISPSLATSQRSICGKAVTVSTANVYLKLFGERVRTWKCRSELWIGVNCCDDSTLVGQKNAKS